MSMCEAPPQRKNRMVDLALPPDRVVVGTAIPCAIEGMPNEGVLNPARPVVDATRNCRRSMAGLRGDAELNQNNNQTFLSETSPTPSLSSPPTRRTD